MAAHGPDRAPRFLTYRHTGASYQAMPERTTVRLAEDLLSRAKLKAMAEGRTLTSLIEEGLRAVVAEKPGTAGIGRLTPRTSKARGGLVAGVSLDDMVSLQEIDDLAGLQRSK